jgi:hypothetical protein
VEHPRVVWETRQGAVQEAVHALRKSGTEKKAVMGHDTISPRFKCYLVGTVQATDA